MPQPFHNPFYSLLVTSCAALLVTMLVCVTMWVNPQEQAPLWVVWIDHHWFRLVVAEVGAIVLFGCMTIGLDRFFESRSRRYASSVTESASTDESV